MVSVFHAELESCPENSDGTCLALYFEELPRNEDVDRTCQELIGELSLSVLEGEKPQFREVPSKVSERAKLVRILVYNIG